MFPKGDKFATVSEDGTLRVWNIAERKQEKIFYLADDGKTFERSKEGVSEVPNNAKGHAIDIGPKMDKIKGGELAVIGFKDGSVRVVDLDTGATKHNKNYFTSAVSVIRISPDKRYVAIGSEGTTIRIFEYPSMASLPQSTELKGHLGSITQLDWSEDSCILHSNSTDRKLLFWKVKKDKATDVLDLPCDPERYRDEKWATWTCIYGWPVQGIVYEQSMKFLSCMRSTMVYDQYQLLATGDDGGLVRVYRYPCLKRGASYLKGKGHSSAVSCVRFTPDDKHVISVGLKDGCVFQWDIC